MFSIIIYHCRFLSIITSFDFFWALSRWLPRFIAHILEATTPHFAMMNICFMHEPSSNGLFRFPHHACFVLRIEGILPSFLDIRWKSFRFDFIRWWYFKTCRRFLRFLSSRRQRTVTAQARCGGYRWWAGCRFRRWWQELFDTLKRAAPATTHKRRTFHFPPIWCRACSGDFSCCHSRRYFRLPFSLPIFNIVLCFKRHMILGYTISGSK